MSKFEEYRNTLNRYYYGCRKNDPWYGSEIERAFIGFNELAKKGDKGAIQCLDDFIKFAESSSKWSGLDSFITTKLVLTSLSNKLLSKYDSQVIKLLENMKKIEYEEYEKKRIKEAIEKRDDTAVKSFQKLYMNCPIEEKSYIDSVIYEYVTHENKKQEQ